MRVLSAFNMVLLHSMYSTLLIKLINKSINEIRISFIYLSIKRNLTYKLWCVQQVFASASAEYKLVLNIVNLAVLIQQGLLYFIPI